MKQVFYVLTFLFMFSSLETIAQKNDTINIRNGALLVRLQTSKLKINALKEMGNTVQAEAIRIAQDSTNSSIITAFKKNFNFCPVYFFYSDHSTEVKEGKLKGVIFDVNMKTDTSFNSNDYLIGEYDESRITRLDGFFIKDKNYKELWASFPHQIANPYIVKKYHNLVITRSDDKVVELLNSGLYNYYPR